MTKLIAYVFLACFGFLCFSCGIQTKLSDEDLKWMPYCQGDTLIFRSTEGVFDTTTIVRRSIFYPNYNPIEVHDKYHPQMGELFYKNKKVFNTESGRLMVMLIKRNPKKPASVSVSFSFTDFDNDTDYFSFLKYNVNVNDMTYDDVYKLQKKYNAEYYDLKEVYWSLSEGLIKYVYSNGEEWELYKRINNCNSERN